MSQQGLEGLERPSSTGLSGVARAGYRSGTCTVTSLCGKLTAEQWKRFAPSTSHSISSSPSCQVQVVSTLCLPVRNPLRLIGGWRSNRNQTLETKKEWKKERKKRKRLVIQRRHLHEPALPHSQSAWEKGSSELESELTAAQVTLKVHPWMLERSTETEQRTHTPASSVSCPLTPNI